MSICALNTNESPFMKSHKIQSALAIIISNQFYLLNIIENLCTIFLKIKQLILLLLVNISIVSRQTFREEFCKKK